MREPEIDLYAFEEGLELESLAESSAPSASVSTTTSVSSASCPATSAGSFSTWGCYTSDFAPAPALSAN
ncbi:thiocillin family RiPP [Streptomyces sp. NBC_01077]|nr:thiocillin family RiPP [Streptomyces sp. NBC_01077]WSV44352.1 thiocillin family RiPP [Streptomyces sp. NBC_01077]